MRTFLIIITALILSLVISFLIFKFLDNTLGNILVSLANGMIVIVSIYLWKILENR